MNKKDKKKSVSALGSDKRYLLILPDGTKLVFDEPHKQSFDAVNIADTSDLQLFVDGKERVLKASYLSYTQFWKHLAQLGVPGNEE